LRLRRGRGGGLEGREGENDRQNGELEHVGSFARQRIRGAAPDAPDARLMRKTAEIRTMSPTRGTD
jgi:hypothetical protein